ncbi:hypothetical protein PTKIN_Ptkin01aG0039200 [Pterospermum kingtungense]
MQLSCLHLPCKVTATTNILLLLLLHHRHHHPLPPLLSSAPHLSMEEGVTIVTNTNNPNLDHQVIVQIQQPDLPAFRSGTYVVQVPKDRIYRVPPPENALIAERHRNNQGSNCNNYRRCCSRRMCWFLSLVILVMVLGFIAFIVYVYVLK